MNELTIIKHEGGQYVGSRDVAKVIGKDHRHLLRDIRGYATAIEKSNAPNFGLVDFFIESSYLDSKCESRPCYLLSKMGCEMVANKLIGERGVLFTAAYVAKFNEMEQKERAAEIKSHARPRLGEFNSAVRNVLKGMAYCFAKPGRVMRFLRGVYEPLGIEVQTETDGMEYFSATEIARYLGVYSGTGRPHGHAVSAIITKFGDWARHTVSIPYGLVGVMTRYDRNIVERVRGWIEYNNYPHTVPYLGFHYHIYYDRQCSWFDGDGFGGAKI